ncbi:response regulator [Gammaproteobacteria bacterium AS21]
MNQKTVLIVEDEQKLALLLQDYLTHAGYLSHCIYRGDLVIAWLHHNQADLVILDLMLPGTDGITLCHDIRKFSSIPIIMASAKVTEIDRLTGLDIGADDYLCKPYSLREMMSRVNALFRRSDIQTTERQLSKASTIGPFTCDSDKMSIYLNSHLLKLTTVEFRLLSYLLQHPDTVFSRDELLNNIYDDYRLVADRTIDTHIKNLRRKIQQIIADDVIQSIYGAGYKLVLPINSKRHL